MATATRSSYMMTDSGPALVSFAGYQHYCPWIGTVIGKGNKLFFQAYMVALIVSVAVDYTVIFRTGGNNFSTTVSAVLASCFAFLAAVGLGFRAQRHFTHKKPGLSSTQQKPLIEGPKAVPQYTAVQ